LFALFFAHFWLADDAYVSFQPPQVHDVTATFVEIVGTVVDATTVKLLTCINLGSQLGEPGSIYLISTSFVDIKLPIILDLAMVNQVIELTFDPEFKGKLF
jgi:hypothetical protein